MIVKVDRLLVVSHRLGLFRSHSEKQTISPGCWRRLISRQSDCAERATKYSSAVSTISIAELKEKSAEELLNSAGKDNLVITSDGQPVALLLDIHGVSAGSTEALMRSVIALKAQAALQKSSAANGASALSMSEIDAEIAAARRERKQ
jgi:hypothetical protein